MHTRVFAQMSGKVPYLFAGKLVKVVESQMNYNKFPEKTNIFHKQ